MKENARRKKKEKNHKNVCVSRITIKKAQLKAACETANMKLTDSMQAKKLKCNYRP